MIPRRTTILLAIVLFSIAAFPQYAKKRQESKGPRAVAVLEMTPHGMRLVPISLMLDGRYYDASIYMASPVPMALDPGNVYEVQHGGRPVGDFTVTEAEQWPNGVWAADGKWLSNEEKKKREEEQAKAKPVKPGEDENEGPPTLRRAGSKHAETPVEKPASPAPEKPVVAAPAPDTPKPQTSNDSERPILRRGKPEVEQASKIPDVKAAVKPPTKPPAGLNQVQVAVSDAKNNEPHPYTWTWSSAEEADKMRDKIEKLAIAAVSEYAGKTAGPKPGKLEDVDLRTFDLSYSNEPLMILTAKVRPAPAPKKGAKAAPLDEPAGFEYYVTIVAREDIYSNLEKSFGEVTDNKHLDAYPRMQLIDAVDADGNDVGDLLFRRISDLGSSFVLYNASYARPREILRVPEPKF